MNLVNLFPKSFFVQKKDSTVRVILNLKELNSDVEYHHVKMETLKSALFLVKNNCFFGSIDLTDAYFSVKVNKSFENINVSFGMELNTQLCIISR